MPDFRLEEINLLEQDIGPFLFEINERLRIYNDLVRDVETTGRMVYVGDNGFAELSPGTDIATYIAVTSITGDYTVTDTDGVSVLLVDASSAAVTITLPTASANNGRVLHIKKIDSSGNTVTTDGEGAETIDNVATKIIVAQYSDMRIVCDGNEWWIL
jgi:hypothetical protein